MTVKINDDHTVVISFCSQRCFTFTLTGHVETSGNDAPLKDSEHLSWFLCDRYTARPSASSDPPSSSEYQPYLLKPFEP